MRTFDYKMIEQKLVFDDRLDGSDIRDAVRGRIKTPAIEWAI